MEEDYHQLHHQREEKATRPSRLGLRNTGGGGEIVEVQGGHIVRSTGRKDRHSKVCTAKGPRDRRVRLSAHTAIQFYDVQDRLGYDRPSKAVDWLIKKAKASIDELAELPAWKPTADATPIVNLEQNPNNENLNRQRLGQLEEHPDEDIVDIHMGNGQNSSFLPTSLDSIKSFFPAGASSTPPGSNNSSGMQFPHSFPQSELLSRTSSQNQELKLSLQSFQDPIPHHHQGNNNIYFDGSSWPDTGGFSGFVFNSPPTQTTPFLQPLLGQPTNNQLFNYIPERGPLQSSNTPPVRAWVDPPQPFSGAVIDQHPTLAFHHPASMPGFTSGFGFSRFQIPVGIHGDEEEHDDKPSSASSDSHH
ncbi:hypothetical protein L1987_40447 [Smallanthus sonchifolius]|uniref:Uncharacterized protein n=1 Tax=Smallanthus sonchifolius TaxID=185202 RepID=A0ACB9GU65_9ASTR|nr:hypothetical protein L1987_40447 [Smallanthus sonchifolius]